MLGIEEKLNIDGDEPTEEKLIIECEEVEFDENNPDKDLVDDYVFIRRKLRYSVAACEAVLRGAMNDMGAFPGARSVEACATIIKTITECTSQLLDLHAKRKKTFMIQSPSEDEKSNGDDKEKSVKCRVDQIIGAFFDEQELEDNTAIED